MFFIRQGATHKVCIGPAVAVGDGFTPVTTLALSTADEAEVILHDNGTVVDISGYTWAAIATADGYYHLTLQSGISGTVGHMTVVINDDSLCLPVKAEFTIVEEAVYDAFYAASAPGYVANAPVNVAQFGGSNGTFASGRPEVNVSHLGGNSNAAGSLTRTFQGSTQGTADSGTATTMVDAALTEATTDHYKGARIVFSTGTNAGQSRLITGFTPASDTITFTPALPDDVTTENYVIIGEGAADVHAWLGSLVATPSVAGVPEVDLTHINGAAQTATLDTIKAETATILADTNELQTNQGNWLTATGFSTHSASDVWAVGTRVLTANTNLNDPTAAAIADAVWDEAATGHTDAGKAGAQLWTDIDAILVDTAEIGTAGAGLTNINLPDQTMNITGDITGNLSGSVGSVTGNVGGNVTGSVGSLATQAKADVNAEVDGAIETYHLDHLLAATYDPASKPGAADALLNELIESDAGVSRFTANALEQAPTGGSAPSAADIRAEIDSNSTQLAAIVADTNELQGDWADGGRLDLILDARASQSSVDDLPTNAELATALGTADDAVLAAVATVDSNVDAIKAKTDSLTFTVAGQVDANIEYVNGTEVTGAGTEGDPWGP